MILSIMSVYDDDPNAFLMMCRLCMSENVDLISLYPKDEFNSTTSTDKIVQIIERFTTIKVNKEFLLPVKNFYYLPYLYRYTQWTIFHRKSVRVVYK